MMYRDDPKSIIQGWDKKPKRKRKKKAKKDLSQFDKLLQQSVLKISHASILGRSNRIQPNFV